MKNTFIDWNSRLLPGLHETITNPQESAQAILYLNNEYGFRTFCLMPTYFSSNESVASFLLRRSRAIARLKENLPFAPNIRILEGGCVHLEKSVHEVEQLHKLLLTFGACKYLPILLPVAEFDSWIDYEINRLLYQSNFPLWFVSFELACLFYPDEIIEKLLRIPNAIYQINYRSIENPRMQAVIQKLLRRNATVLLGTALDNVNKCYRFDLPYHLQEAQKALPSDDYHVLLKSSQKLPLKSPRRII